MSIFRGQNGKTAFGLIMGGVAAASFAVTGAAWAADPAPKEKPKKEKKKKEKPTPGPSVSKVFQPAAIKMDKALKAKDFAGLDAAITEGTPLAADPYDKYLLGFYALQAGLNAKDQARQVVALDMMIDSGAAPAADIARYQFFSGNFAYNAKDYAKAIDRLGKAKAGGSTEAALPLLLMDAYYKTNQVDAGLAIAREAIAKRATGVIPAEDVYVRSAQALQKAGRGSEVIDWLTLRLADYPQPKIWRNALFVYLQTLKPEAETTLDALRLMRETGAMEQRAEYLEYSQNLIDKGLRAELIDVITMGRSSGAIPAKDTTFDGYWATHQPKVAQDKLDLPLAERDAGKQATGKIARVTGDALLGYGEYARAKAMYELAMTKGGEDADLINMRLGIAATKSKDYAGALAAFAKVTGPRKQLADMWVTHIRSAQKAAAPATTTAS